MPLFDAHNHLQDERFAEARDRLVCEAISAGVKRMVVNGSCEVDWPDVARLAELYPVVLPSFGLHPWHHHERSPNWLRHLESLLITHPYSAVGEIGIDRWKEGLPYDNQESVFLDQWEIARRLNRPVSIHCLKAWGRLLDLLQANPGPTCGFLLHSYGGPAEMIDSFVRLGAYFSFPGYFLRPRKEKPRDVFRHVPSDRLLVETDAPDQQLPDELNHHPLLDSAGKPINHPANLDTIYAGLATLRRESLPDMTNAVARNFNRLFLHA
jgi:TatD DNase family protein